MNLETGMFYNTMIKTLKALLRQLFPDINWSIADYETVIKRGFIDAFGHPNGIVITGSLPNRPKQTVHISNLVLYDATPMSEDMAITASMVGARMRILLKDDSSLPIPAHTPAQKAHLGISQVRFGLSIC
ncbi:hypothetical protein Haur_1327 [Herpetosiphon aurantiacus DSM 785]|uniref:Uncharacterized protein n=1 Tax=Herpetosiphon aurantiacus (strain ATCC 23779 / DSM 785 / 114-95) TaxID=316274 RepID=A9B2C7_HERA2|nr:hypothetical protein Haur_1327 [Herpetosiphon aurantiacus DSM 785]